MKDQTKVNITEAFIELLNELNFDKITVSDIARKAGINRGTFYLHYLDKFDLMDQIQNNIVSDLNILIINHSNNISFDDPLELIPYDVILNALYYIKDNFKVIKSLFSNGTNIQFVLLVKSVISDILENQLKKSDSLLFTKKQLPDDYAKEILLSAIVSILMLWIKKDLKESPELIADIIQKAKQISPYELLL